MTTTGWPSAERAVERAADLVQRARLGETAAFTALYEDHVGPARSEARRRVRNHADVDDVVSMAFGSVFLALQRGGGPTDAFRAYLLTAVRNAVLQMSRTKRFQNEIPTDVVGDAVSAAPSIAAAEIVLDPIPDPSTEHPDADRVRDAFRALPDRWRSILWRTEVEGWSPQDLSDELGMSRNAVAALSLRAREGLRQHFAAAG